ncbi:hypothetical protein PQX77_019927 [Marasmius sp. AFHP31]|nr:hypothetical protein PQX77_019927 [Marasmius sp. AFHP31]
MSDPSSVEDAWEVLSNHVRKYDNEMVNGWNEDIDTLLVFAGLFSAVVTAFTIESYKWLSEGPADATVILLTQISSQLAGSNSSSLPSAAHFKPTPSSIRINTFWFLSLILSLSSSLFSLLCKQWLREYRRDTHTRSQGEAQALRQLRKDSFESWRVPVFLSTLPCLIEVALLLFFVGILDLLWTLHIPPVFAVGGIAIVLSGSCYLLTTLLPGLTIIASIFRDVRDYLTFAQYPHYELTCPYKSPLAWGIFRIFGRLISLHSLNRLLFRFAADESRRRSSAACARYFRSDIHRCADWSVLDHHLIGRSRWHPAINVYCLASLRSLVATFRDTPSILPSLKTILFSFPPQEIVPVVFNEWRLAMWVEPSLEDVKAFISVSDHLSTRLSTRRQSVGFTSSDHFSRSALSPRLMTLNWQFLLNSRSMDRSYEKFFNHPGVLTYQVKQALEKWIFLLDKNKPGRTGLHFILPFYVAERLWTHPDARVREAGLEYLVVYERGWETYTAPRLEPSARVEESEDERYALISSLSKHLDRPGNDSPSVLVSSQRGLRFLVHTNDQIIRHCLFNTTLGTRRRILEDWKRVISQVCRDFGLPVECFREIPDASQIEILTDRGPTTMAITSQIVVEGKENKAVQISEESRSSIV